MANNNTFNRVRNDSSSSDDCIFVGESLSQDKQRLSNPPAKLNISTVKLNNAPANITPKALIHKFSLSNTQKLSKRTMKTIADTCNAFRRDVLSQGTTKRVNFTINITKAANNENMPTPIKPQKNESEDGNITLLNPFPVQSNKSENINCQGSSNSKAIVASVSEFKKNINEDNSSTIIKDETKKLSQNTEFNLADKTKDTFNSQEGIANKLLSNTTSTLDKFANINTYSSFNKHVEKYLRSSVLDINTHEKTPQNDFTLENISPAEIKNNSDNIKDENLILKNNDSNLKSPNVIDLTVDIMNNSNEMFLSANNDKNLKTADDTDLSLKNPSDDIQDVNLVSKTNDDKLKTADDIDLGLKNDSDDILAENLVSKDNINKLKTADDIDLSLKNTSDDIQAENLVPVNNDNDLKTAEDIDLSLKNPSDDIQDVNLVSKTNDDKLKTADDIDFGLKNYSDDIVGENLVPKDNINKLKTADDIDLSLKNTSDDIQAENLVSVNNDHVLKTADDTDLSLKNPSDDTDLSLKNPSDDTDLSLKNPSDDTDLSLKNPSDDTDLSLKNPSDDIQNVNLVSVINDINLKTPDECDVQEDLKDIDWWTESFDDEVPKAPILCAKNISKLENNSGNSAEGWEKYFKSNESDLNSSAMPSELDETNRNSKRKAVDDIPDDTKKLKTNIVLDDVPYVTCKKNMPAARKKPSDYLVDKIFRFHIEDILKSELIQKEPDVYRFHDVKYRFVRITGTVSYLQRVSSSKAFLKLYDGSGEICCSFTDFEDRLKNRVCMTNHLDAQSNRKLIPKKQLICMGVRNDIKKIERYMQKTTPKDNPFLNSMTKILLEKMVKDQPPVTKNIQLGDFLTISGKVVDLNERLIYVWNIAKEDETEFKRGNKNDNYPPLSQHHKIDTEAVASNGKEFIYRNFKSL